MNRTIFTVVALVFTAGLSAGVAQAQATSQATTPTQQPAPTRHMKGGHDLFAGIQLSDAQKAQIKTIQDKYAASASKNRQSMKASHDAYAKAKAANDTATMRSLQQQWKQVAATRKQERQAVENVLTPTQRTQLEKNKQAMRAKFQHREQDHAQGGTQPQQQQ